MELEPDESLRTLFPSFSDAQLARAEDNLDLYLQLVVRMYNRIAADPEAYAHFKTLTVSEPYVSIRAMRSKPTANQTDPSPAP